MIPSVENKKRKEKTAREKNGLCLFDRSKGGEVYLVEKGEKQADLAVTGQ